MTSEGTGNPELQQLQAQLSQIIETHIELGILVHDFEGTAQAKEGLLERVNLLAEQLHQVQTNAYDKVRDIQVPLDIVQYIEDGRNPDVYTREFVELLAKQNQYVNGKMKAMKQFRDILGTKIKEAYPDMESSVDGVIERTGN
uniref:Mediator of RNA polymerase II transcription subunit 10 n=1 Tax=Blastobotrys adeninivorans TaxID=409370 RepID=A0A060T9T1_BLAAD